MERDARPMPGHTSARAADSTPSGRLLVSCRDRPGLVAAVSGFLASHHANITDAHQHGERGMFFMRLAFTLPADASRDTLTDAVTELAAREGLDARLAFGDTRPRVALLVSRQDHCLRDLLYRHELGELPCDVAVVVSNHPDAQTHADRRGLPFVCLPVTPGGEAEQERRVAHAVARHGCDLIVLARYMRILSPELAGRWSGRCINVHHGLLPAFKGARPYHQAWERGVKLVGATAHYVTADLDAGPIVAQEVEPVGHRETVDDLVRKGRDLERRVLARAVRAHLENRVILAGGRAIVFD